MAALIMRTEQVNGNTFELIPINATFEDPYTLKTLIGEYLNSEGFTADAVLTIKLHMKRRYEDATTMPKPYIITIVGSEHCDNDFNIAFMRLCQSYYFYTSNTVMCLVKIVQESIADYCDRKCYERTVHNLFQ